MIEQVFTMCNIKSGSKNIIIESYTNILFN